MNTIDSVESFDWIHEISSTEKRLVERRIVLYLQSLGLEYNTESTKK